METAAPELEAKMAGPDWRRSRLDPSDGGDGRTGAMEATGPGLTETAGPGQTETAGPSRPRQKDRGRRRQLVRCRRRKLDRTDGGSWTGADGGSWTGTGSCCSLSRCVCVCMYVCMYVCMCEVYQHLLTALHEFNSVGRKSCSVFDLVDAI